MRQPILDPTAGERARAIREHGAAQRITDPTDPRCGELACEATAHVNSPQRILDPTDPEFGALAA